MQKYKEAYQQCIEGSKSLFLEGTKDNEIFKKPHYFVRYEVFRCTEEMRNTKKIDRGCKSNFPTIYPECASDSEIDRWLEKKKI